MNILRIETLDMQYKGPGHDFLCRGKRLCHCDYERICL